MKKIFKIFFVLIIIMVVLLYKKVIYVEYISQAGYPTGCESVSATMVLKYYGFDMTVDKFIDNYLNKNNLEKMDGILYGPHPNESFVGNPRNENSFGCFSPVIENAFERIVDEKYDVVNETGLSLDLIALKYITRGIPVLIWATIDMNESYPSTGWTVKNTGEKFMWRANEHCLVLVGFDFFNYYFNDPYNNKGLVKYEKSIVRQRYSELGKQAIIIKPNT
jgi:uncharacterized protein YvpB